MEKNMEDEMENWDYYKWPGFRIRVYGAYGRSNGVARVENFRFWGLCKV